MIQLEKYIPDFSGILNHTEKGSILTEERGVKALPLSCWRYVLHRYFAWLPCVTPLAILCLEVYFKSVQHIINKIVPSEIGEENDPCLHIATDLKNFSIEKLDVKSPLRRVAAQIEACQQLYKEKALLKAFKTDIAPINESFNKHRDKLSSVSNRIELLKMPEMPPTEDPVCFGDLVNLQESAHMAIIGEKTEIDIIRPQLLTLARQIKNREHYQWLLMKYARELQEAENEVSTHLQAFLTLKSEVEKVMAVYSDRLTVLPFTESSYLPIYIETRINSHDDLTKVIGCNNLIAELKKKQTEQVTRLSMCTQKLTELGKQRAPLQQQFDQLMKESDDAIARADISNFLQSFPKDLIALIKAYGAWYIDKPKFASFKFLETRVIDLVKEYDLYGDFEKAQFVLMGCRSDVLYDGKILAHHLRSLPIHEDDFVLMSRFAHNGFDYEILEGEKFDSLETLINRVHLLDDSSKPINVWNHSYEYDRNQPENGFHYNRLKHMARLTQGVSEPQHAGIFSNSSNQHKFVKYVSDVLEDENERVEVSNAMDEMVSKISKERVATRKRKVWFFVEQHEALHFFDWAAEKLFSASPLPYAIFASTHVPSTTIIEARKQAKTQEEVTRLIKSCESIRDKCTLIQNGIEYTNKVLENIKRVVVTKEMLIQLITDRLDKQESRNDTSGTKRT